MPSQPEQGALELDTAASIAQELESRAEAQEETDGLQEEKQASTEEIEESTEADDVEETEAAEEEDSDESDQSDTDEPEESEEGTDYETLNDFAEALEMPLENLMDTIKTRVKVNGEEFDVTLAEAIKGYQMEADYRRKTSELAEQRKTFDDERTQQTTQIQEALSQVNVLLTNEEQALQDEYSKVNWQELQEYDQQDYLVKKDQFQDRYQAIQQKRQQAQTQAAQIQQQQYQEHQAFLRDLIAKESELVTNVIPDWNNTEVKEKEQAQIRDFLVDNGFSEREILMQMDEAGNILEPGLIDHRVLPLVRDAMRYRNQGDKIEIAKKKVKTLPKLVKAGNKQTTQERRTLKKRDATQKFMKSGSRDDLVQALLERTK